MSHGRHSERSRSEHSQPCSPGACCAGADWSLTFLIRALYPGQPIVENYVGRQVPTAMVARNLDRGSGLLRPQLETAPFPNYFVVEPPALRVAGGRSQAIDITGLAAGRADRLGVVTALAAWGLYLLVRRARARAWRSWPFSPSRSSRSRSGTAAPSSPTPQCWAPPWRAWRAGIDRSGAASRRLALAGWFLLALGSADQDHVRLPPDSPSVR